MRSWLNSIADAGRDILFGRRARRKQDDLSPSELLSSLCEELYSSKGEALGTALACDVVDTYHSLPEVAQCNFFQLLLSDYSPDPDHILKSAKAYQEVAGPDTLRSLYKAVEAPRQTLLRRINMAPEGTKTIVLMREHLLACIQQYPQLKSVDLDFRHLLGSWFNRGFLILKRIDWKTPAHILEKLMNYEAVHAVNGWQDLRRRLATDRRCYAFFHPALPDEPLIFVQVALVDGLASSIQELLADEPEADIGDKLNTAIFYSISDCQKGLKGISFGNFLIKQVVMELQQEIPAITRFATLSPIPGFRRWLNTQLTGESKNLVITDDEVDILSLLQDPSWPNNRDDSQQLESVVTRLCAHYLYSEKDGNLPADSVARFHLCNGAMIDRLNWFGDLSEKGLQQSVGMLVNYRYDLDRVEKNHEAYVNEGKVAVTDEFSAIVGA